MKKRERIKPFYNPISQKEVYKIIQEIPSWEHKQLAKTLYLFGLRVTEALNLKVGDITREKFAGQTIYKCQVATLKNKKYPVRQPIAWDKGIEGKMAKELYNEYIKKHKDPQQILFFTSRQNAYWHFKKVSFTTTAVTYKPRETFKITRGLFPHFLRHCRASHLVNMYGFNEIQLMIYMGWSDPKVATFYVKSDWKNLAKAMIGALK